MQKFEIFSLYQMKLNDNYELLLEKINCAVDIKQPQTLKLQYGLRELKLKIEIGLWKLYISLAHYIFIENVIFIY